MVSSLSFIKVSLKLLRPLLLGAVVVAGLASTARATDTIHHSKKLRSVYRSIAPAKVRHRTRVVHRGDSSRYRLTEAKLVTKVTPPVPAPRKIETIQFSQAGLPKLNDVPPFSLSDGGRFYAFDESGQRVTFSVDPVLQREADSILATYRVPWGALVALDPRSGRVLALSSYSRFEPEGGNLALRATFPAASLFKVVTAAAGIERAGLRGPDMVRFHGGNYTLGRTNYLPDTRKDRRLMSLSEAMGKSCNPVFARVALNHLDNITLAQYALNFGFNSLLPFEAPLQPSRFHLENDSYEFARTAAGFGDVRISPLHAAVLMGALANNGRMLRPYMVERIATAQGHVRYEAAPSEIRRPVLSSTADELLNMMRATAETGTARRYFGPRSTWAAKDITIVGKTGTLSGSDPEGLYHWFIAAAPEEAPQIVISALVIDRGGTRIKATGAARLLLDKFFERNAPAAPLRIARSEKAPVAKKRRGA